MNPPRIDIYVESDDPHEVERLDETARLLGAEMLELQDVTAVEKIPAGQTPPGTRSSGIWADAALGVVLSGVGYRVITSRTAGQVSELLTAFINRNKGKNVRVEYDGKEMRIAADEMSDETVQRLTHFLVRQSQNRDDG